MKDMYEQVVKFGAYIVDALREYKQPVLIYIPPNGELRGGAWVVVDPTINQRYMEMYADKESRGGVLEAEGTVEIKYRNKDLVKTIHRLDPVCKEIREKLKVLNTTSSINNTTISSPINEKDTSSPILSIKPNLSKQKLKLIQEQQPQMSPQQATKLINYNEKVDESNLELTPGEIDALKVPTETGSKSPSPSPSLLFDTLKDQIKLLEKQLQARENYLLPIYHQVAVQFADLHDTPGRMLNKNVIREVIEWSNSRKFFYWRLKRLLAQNNIVDEIIRYSNNEIEYNQALELLRNCFEQVTDKSENSWEKDNEIISGWLENQLDKNQKLNVESLVVEKLKKFKQASVLTQLKTIIEDYPDVAIESIRNLSDLKNTQNLKEIVAALNEKIKSEENTNS
jgi:acetyl-CoA carboxylase / biotin carboxylase 1